VYSGALHGDWRLIGDRLIEGPDYLGGIPFGKMDALEAVSIRGGVETDCEGSFSALLLRPSLKLLQIKISTSVGPMIDRIAKDLAGKRVDQVETLVLVMWRFPDDFIESLPRFLALFPKLKSLRVATETSVGGLGLELGWMLRRTLGHLSELVMEGHEYFQTADFSAKVQFTVRGLGSGWTLGRGCRKATAHFLAEGRDRAKFSSYFFEDRFFEYGI
jgi:hypothetical protein